MTIINTANQSIQSVIQNYNNGVYTCNEPRPKYQKLQPTYVFDENLSVAKNRELVEKHNAEQKALQEAHRDKVNYLSSLLIKDAETALIHEYGLTQEQAAIINGYAYQEYHSSIFDYLNHLYELGDLASKLVNTAR